jgi:hypothetical protein
MMDLAVDAKSAVYFGLYVRAKRVQKSIHGRSGSLGGCRGETLRPPPAAGEVAHAARAHALGCTRAFPTN